jgi:hypothetical protein
MIWTFVASHIYKTIRRKGYDTLVLKKGFSIMANYRVGQRRPEFLLLVNFSALVLPTLIIGLLWWLPTLATHAADPNPNCTLIVPNNPLSAKGLATPYQLAATDNAGGPCNEANKDQSAFVQGIIYDSATGAISAYSPLVTDKGTKPTIPPAEPTLPARAVVGLAFGFNGTNLTLQGAQGNTLKQANCVNGLNDSVFGQFAYCNTPALFSAIQQGIAAGKVKVPPLATAKDGLPCPTTRDFSVIDQDQSDNVQSQYLADDRGQTAQFSDANQAAIPHAKLISNPSDNALLTNFIDPALGCKPWTVPDLANNNAPVSTLVTDEVQAQADQQEPIALMPLTDPMTEIANDNGDAQQSLDKTNLYRRGVGQLPAQNNNDASGTTYCRNFLTTGIPRIVADSALTVRAPSPKPDEANSLLTFLAMRANQSYTMLNCEKLLQTSNPITVTANSDGVMIDAAFDLQKPAVPPTAVPPPLLPPPTNPAPPPTNPTPRPPTNPAPQPPAKQPRYVPSGNGQQASVTAVLTWYGFNDNSGQTEQQHGSAAIGHPRNAGNPTLHNQATEGRGSFDDPITFAARNNDQATFPIGSVIYVPLTQKYYIMEDTCGDTNTQGCLNGTHHVDLWMGPPQASGSALPNCENKNTPGGAVQVIINPSPSLPVDTTPEFSNGQCSLHTYTQ